MYKVQVNTIQRKWITKKVSSTTSPA